MSTYLLNALHVELVQGDDYLDADGRALVVSGAGVCWPAAVASVKLIVREPQDCGCAAAGTEPAHVLELVGVHAPATSDAAAQVRFDIPRAQTLRLALGVRRYAFEVRATLASASVITLARGAFTVLAGGQ